MNFRFVPRRAVRSIALAAVALLTRSSVGGARVSPPAPSAAPAGDHVVHLRLEKSEPAAGAVLAASPSAIRLWFSLPPEMAVTVVRLTNAGGAAIPLGTPRRGTGASDPVEVPLKQPLPAGSYTVSWKTSSRDGHPIKGDFRFSVKAAAG